MDSTTLLPQETAAATATVTSRLPAGSTLEIAPGIHVPHPHAEVNLPGQGDPRAGDTKAVSEAVKLERDDEKTTATLVQEPLHDFLKVKSTDAVNIA